MCVCVVGKWKLYIEFGTTYFHIPIGMYSTIFFNRKKILFTPIIFIVILLLLKLFEEREYLYLLNENADVQRRRTRTNSYSHEPPTRSYQQAGLPTQPGRATWSVSMRTITWKVMERNGSVFSHELICKNCQLKSSFTSTLIGQLSTYVRRLLLEHK